MSKFKDFKNEDYIDIECKRKRNINIYYLSNVIGWLQSL